MELDEGVPVEEEDEEGVSYEEEDDIPVDERSEWDAEDVEEQETDDGELFEELVSKVSQSDLRKRIDEYLDRANTEYDLGRGTKVRALPQFRYAKAGGIDLAKARLKDILGAAFEKRRPRAVHNAVYGRAKPSDIAAITQALIDKGELVVLRAERPGLSDDQLVRALQRKFRIGIDCAGYVQLAFIFAFTGSDDDPPKVRVGLGLDKRRGYEKLARLSPRHFTKVNYLDGQTGDLFVMRPRAGDRDRAWHTVIIVDHTVSGSEHTFLVDASWGTDLYGEAAGGVARRNLVQDASPESGGTYIRSMGRRSLRTRSARTPATASKGYIGRDERSRAAPYGSGESARVKAEIRIATIHHSARSFGRA